MKPRSIIKLILCIFIITSLPALSQQNVSPIDLSGWQDTLNHQTSFSTTQLMDKSSTLIQESIRLLNNGETESGLKKALASLIIAKHVQNVIKNLETYPTLDRSINQLDEYLIGRGLTNSTIEQSYSAFLEYTITEGVNIRHYSQDVQSNNPIPPQRLHWPNTVIQHYDSRGKPNGYSVLPARSR